jgi:two-component sensor histidine kinase
MSYSQIIGQAYIDSLSAEIQQYNDDTNKVRALADLSFELSDFDLKKAITAGKQALRLSLELGYAYGTGLSKLALAYHYYYYHSQWDSTFIYAKDAEQFFLERNDSDRLCLAYCLESRISWMFELKVAKEYHDKAKSLIERIKDVEWRKRNLVFFQMIAQVHDPDKRCSILKELYQIYMGEGNDLSTAKAYSALAVCYSAKGNNDSAIYYRELAVPLFERSERKLLIAQQYFNLAWAYRSMIKDDSTSGQLYRQKAEDFLLRSTNLNKELEWWIPLFNAYLWLYYFKKEEGQTDQAFYFLEQYHKYYQDWIDRRVDFYMTVDVYQNQFELNKLELGLIKAQNDRRLTILISTASGMFVLLLVISLFIIIWRKNIRLRRQEMDHQIVILEQKALQSMMNPHFIFNTLGSIQSYLLQNKPGEAGIYLSQFARLIRLNITSINAPMINLEEEVNRLRIYLDLEKFRMGNTFEYTIELNSKIEEEDLYIPSMIIQPFIENSIWHGIAPLEGKGMIRIFLAFHSTHALKVIIEDNGVGMKQSEKFTSKKEEHLHLSMEVIRKRLEIIGKKMKIETAMSVSEAFPGEPNPGTRVELILPFTYGESM